MSMDHYKYGYRYKIQSCRKVDKILAYHEGGNKLADNQVNLVIDKGNYNFGFLRAWKHQERRSSTMISKSAHI